MLHQPTLPSRMQNFAPHPLFLSCFAAATKLTTAQQYVQKLSIKVMHERLTSQGGIAIASLDSNAGRSLAAQVNDPSFMNKLERQLRPLRHQLGIGEGLDWSPDSAEYQVRTGG